MFALFVLLLVSALSTGSGYCWYLGMRREVVKVETRKRHLQVAVALALSAGVVATAGVVANPYVRVWTYGMEGRAQMAQAEANRQIKVREAQSTRDAAILLAEAEVARAKGVAEANRIVADGLGGPEGYLRYLYIEGLKDAREKGSAQVIYVATEAGLPILEANRLPRSAP